MLLSTAMLSVPFYLSTGSARYVAYRQSDFRVTTWEGSLAIRITQEQQREQ